jgi:hypothetical protein
MLAVLAAVVILLVLGLFLLGRRSGPDGEERPSVARQA